MSENAGISGFRQNTGRVPIGSDKNPIIFPIGFDGIRQLDYSSWVPLEPREEKSDSQNSHRNFPDHIRLYVSIVPDHIGSYGKSDAKSWFLKSYIKLSIKSLV